MSLRTEQELVDVERSYYLAQSLNSGLWQDPEAHSLDQFLFILDCIRRKKAQKSNGKVQE